METNSQSNAATNGTDQNVGQTNIRKKKKYHSSALYAASLAHSAVKHVKAPNAGHALLPTQM